MGPFFHIDAAVLFFGEQETAVIVAGDVQHFDLDWQVASVERGCAHPVLDAVVHVEVQS